MQYNLNDRSALKNVSDAWDFSVDPDAQSLETHMIDLMLSNNGIGLAANQIGLNKRVFVTGHLDNKEFPKPFALFNPIIIEKSEEMVLDKEGCLSFPGLYLSIKRPRWVKIEYQDSQGERQTLSADGYFSKCIQHEIDHLDGVCFIDKVSAMKLQLANKKLRKITK
jgi:peptide deformylase